VTLARSDTKATVFGGEVLITEFFPPVPLLSTLVLAREVSSLIGLVPEPTTVPAVQRDLRVIDWAQPAGDMIVR
jgi:hypothetical protein